MNSIDRNKGVGAGDENRTHVSSLEGLCSTTELRPRNFGFCHLKYQTRNFVLSHPQLTYEQRGINFLTKILIPRDRQTHQESLGGHSLFPEYSVE